MKKMKEKLRFLVINFLEGPVLCLHPPFSWGAFLFLQITIHFTPRQMYKICKKTDERGKGLERKKRDIFFTIEQAALHLPRLFGLPDYLHSSKVFFLTVN